MRPGYGLWGGNAKGGRAGRGGGGQPSRGGRIQAEAAPLPARRARASGAGIPLPRPLFWRRFRSWQDGTAPCNGAGGPAQIRSEERGTMRYRALGAEVYNQHQRKLNFQWHQLRSGNNDSIQSVCMLVNFEDNPCTCAVTAYIDGNHQTPLLQWIP
jgi:hypothetical protein